MGKEEVMAWLKSLSDSNWRKLVLGLGIILLALVAVIVRRTPLPSTVEEPPIAEEEYAVYGALIDAMYVDAIEGVELVVISDHTVTGDYPGGSLDSTLEHVRGKLQQKLEPKTIDDFRLKNKQTYKLSRKVPLKVKYILLSKEEHEGIFEEGGGWKQFYATYPKSQGVMTLSRVGFNTETDQALVYVGNQSHYLAGTGYYVLLAKEDGVWVVQDQVMAWIS